MDRIKTQLNLDLARRVYDQITQYPDSHNQINPERCVMGWAVELGESRRRLYEGTAIAGSRNLGVTLDQGDRFFREMSNRKARWMLGDLIRTEEKKIKRWLKAEAKAEAKAAKAEEARQREIDRQARRQVREVYAKVRRDMREKIHA